MNPRFAIRQQQKQQQQQQQQLMDHTPKGPTSYFNHASGI